eukprot:TRINITY_DN37452_c0_g1_i1.p1 TRINITY_DN37452_c0_g1~~TRINITY_DN37452_c0_g1_i1.p1  ORF type:complete len:917 (+),score=165.89 TRINITY_DN37452_c0_g1_i1:125-2875(+)
MPPKSIPLKWAAIAFMVPCLLISASTTVLMSNKNAEDALSKQRDHQDDITNSCFESAESRILSVTSALMSERLESLSCSVNRKLDQIRITLAALLRLTKYWNTPMSWTQYLDFVSYISSLHATNDIVSAVGFVGDDGKMFIISDFAILSGNDTELSYEVLVTNVNGGPTSSLGILCDSYWYNETKPVCTQQEMNHLLKGTADRAAVFRDISKCDVPATSLSVLPTDMSGSYSIPPSQEPTWGRLSAFSLFSGPLLMSRLNNDDGTAYVSTDIEVLSNAIRAAFAKGSKTDSERLMLATPTCLIAASHGLSWTYSEKVTHDGSWVVEKIPLSPTDNATDPTIRSLSLKLTDEAQKAELSDPRYADATRNPFKHAENIQIENNITVQTFILTNGDGDEKEVYVGVKELRDDYNMGWWMVVCLDADFSLGATRELRKEVVALVEQHNCQVESELHKERNIHVGIVAAISVVFVAVSVVISFLLSNSLRRLDIQMHRVANLQLEEVNDDTPPSFLTEVASMQHSFKIMTSSIREYRPYMPQSLHPFVSNKSEDEAVMMTGGGDLTSTGSSSSREGIKRKGSVLSTTTTTSSKKKVLAVHIQRRKGCAQVAIGCHDFAKFSHTHDPHHITEFHSSWLQICLSESSVFHGTVERFNGDRVFVNFGGLKPCIGSSLKAAKYSSIGVEKLSILSEEYGTLSVLPAMGIASGSCLVGNMGCTGMKAPSVMGKIAINASAILGLCANMKFDILIDSRCADEIKSQFHTSAVDYLKLPESPRPHTIFKMTKVMNTNTEWMYALHDRDSPYDRAWSLLMQNASITQVADLMSALPQGDPMARVVSNRLRRYNEEVLLVTGKAPTEYCTLYREKVTVPLPVFEYLETRLSNSEVSTPSESLPLRLPSSGHKKVQSSPAPSNDKLEKLKT